MSRRRLFALFAASSVLFASNPLYAQEDHHGGCDMPPTYVPAELLQRDIPLRKGIGNSRETITTKSVDAQAYYNQGLNYLES